MNCQEFWSQTPEGSGDPCAAGLEHLSECQACAAEWAGQQQVAGALRHLAEEWSSLEAPAPIEDRLAAAFRAKAGNRPQSYRPARIWMGAFAWATAAVVVLALAISLVRVREPQSATPRRVPGNPAILATAVEIPDVTAEPTMESGFVPLPNVEQLAPNEQGDVVRLELPRSAMIALGLEVSPEWAAEPVQAEVMYGPDGVARAVRFLD